MERKLPSRYTRSKYAQLSANYANANPNRVMTTVTLEMANGQQILKESVGAFPVTEPEEVEE